jgi:hypothetical protein
VRRAGSLLAHLASLHEKVGRVIDRLEGAESAAEVKVLLAAIRESKDLLALALRYAPAEDPAPPVVVQQVSQDFDLDGPEMRFLRDEFSRFVLDREGAMTQVVSGRLSAVPEDVRQEFAHIGWHMDQAAREVRWRLPGLQEWWDA